MASFNFSPEESEDNTPAAMPKFHDIPHIDFQKKRFVDSYLRKFELDRLQQHSFMAIAEYLKEANEIDFQTFLTLREMTPKNSKQYFSAKVFMYLQPDKAGYVSSEALIRYIHKSMGLENLIFKLLSFSAHNDDMGWITSDQLQMFILKEFIHLIDPRNSMDESFYEFYACTAVAKFLFYLDQRRTNKLSIRLLVHSVVMDELQNLAQLQTYQDEYLDTEYLSKIESNWFHYENVLNVYHSFLQLDADQNGLLSLREMEHFRGFSLHPMQFSKTAIRRIAEELIEFAPFELDYRGYLKLVLALDDVTNNTGDMSKTGSSATETNDEIRTPKNVHGLRFFWQVIDFDKSGVLSPMKIQYFINDIIPEMTRIGQYGEGEVPSVHTVIGEIYDMIGYNGSTNSFDTTQGPKLDQILSSHQADVILMMLLDTNTFYRYENRENLMHQSKHNDGDDHDHNQNTDDQLEYSSHQQGSTAGHTPRPPIGEEVKKKFDFNNLKYDDEDDIETDYEF